MTTTGQAGGFIKQKEAFKWHMFDSTALGWFRSIQSPARIDI